MRTLAHGSTLEEDRGLPIRIRDRHGTVALEARWSPGGALERLEVTLPDRTRAAVRAREAEHPLFGISDAVTAGGDAGIAARIQAVNWRCPDAIPPLDAPGALGPGAGTAILNFLALRAGRRALRYRGPYPTAALFDSLLECFRPDRDPADALARFTAGVEEAAVAGEAREPPVLFEPAPFERVWLGAGVCAQLRDGLERAWVRGRAYARGAAGARRIRATGDGGFAAVVEIGGAPWAEIARFSAAGELRAGPFAPPAVAGPLCGSPLPARVVDLLAELLARRAPALLRPALAHVLSRTPILWGDPGEDVCTARGKDVVVHAALAERLSAEDLMVAIVAAVEPVAQRLAQAELASRAATR